LLLRKKKFQEGLLEKTDGQLDNLERLVQDLEFSQVEQQVLDGLKEGNAALQKANDMFSVEEVEQIMFDTQESVDKQREIDELLSGALTQEDEDDVLAELDKLMEDEEQKLPDVPTTQIETEDIELPEVPDQEPEKRKADKEKRVAVEA